MSKRSKLVLTWCITFCIQEPVVFPTYDRINKWMNKIQGSSQMAKDFNHSWFISVTFVCSIPVYLPTIFDDIKQHSTTTLFFHDFKPFNNFHSVHFHTFWPRPKCFFNFWHWRQNTFVQNGPRYVVKKNQDKRFYKFSTTVSHPANSNTNYPPKIRTQNQEIFRQAFE